MSGRRIVLAWLAALVLAGCDNGKEPTFQGWIEAELIFVGPDEAGRIETLAVREGDQVEQRAPLFTLDADLQLADVAMQEAAVKNAQLAYDRALALLKTQSGTQRALDDAEAALRTAQARLNSAQTRLRAPQGVQPGHRQRPADLLPGGRDGAGRQADRRAAAAEQRQSALLRQRGDACPSSRSARPSMSAATAATPGITAKISFIARTSEFTPPVIYSLEERSKLVFLIEARPERPERLRVGQPVSVTLGQGP